MLVGLKSYIVIIKYLTLFSIQPFQLTRELRASPPLTCSQARSVRLDLASSVFTRIYGQEIGVKLISVQCYNDDVTRRVSKLTNLMHRF